jgi:hypothetical protein
MYVFILTFLHVHRIFDIATLEKNNLVGQEDELFYATTKGFVVQSSKKYSNCGNLSLFFIGYENLAQFIKVRTCVTSLLSSGAYNIRLENDGLVAMGLSSLPISTFSILYYPFCFLIDMLSGLSKNVLMHGLAD